MISIGLRTFLPAVLTTLALASPAAAELPVTTTDSDSGLPEEYVVIVEPKDGAVLPGSPDAIVPVVLEYQVFLTDPPLLYLDGDTEIGDCYAQPSPCTIQAAIPSGLHTLRASIGFDEHTITVEVQPTGDTDTGDATDSGGEVTTGGGDPTTSATDGTAGATDGDTGEPGTSGDSTSTSGTTGGATDGGGESDGDKGCGCSSRSAPDVLGLVLAALAFPWRRRRNR